MKPSSGVLQASSWVLFLPGINSEYVVRWELGDSASDQSSVNESSGVVVSLSFTPKEKVMPFLAIDLAS